MEVSLLDVQGLPPGCLVSIRSGTTRRQAPADPEKLRLFFPKGAKDPFKVDLLAPLGSAEIKYQPGANAYPIQVPVNGEIGSVTLSVREMEKPSKIDLNAISQMEYTKEYTKEDKGRPASPSTASRRHRLALQARTYLDEHQLLMFVQSLLQGLIRDKPNDPWEYINEASLTAKKVGVPEPHNGNATPREQTKQVVKEDGFEPPENLEELSEEVAEAVANVGGVAGAATDVQEATPVLTPRAGSVAATQDALSVETVQKALMALEEVPFALKPSVGTWMGKAPVRKQAPSKEEIAETQKKLWAALTKASANGRLDSELARSHEVALKEDALKSLDEASKDGTLSGLASQLKALEELRQKAVDGLTQAVSDGSLERNLQAPASRPDTSESMSISELQQRARGVLLQASQSGRLSEALGEQRASTAKASVPVAALAPFGAYYKVNFRGGAEASARSLFGTGKVQAASSLQAAPSTPLTPELSTLRDDMRKLLVKAAGDGSFEKALDEIRQPAEATASLPWFPLPWKEELTAWQASKAPEEASGIDDVRAHVLQARAALLEATQDGRLLDALESTQKEKEDAELRESTQQARNVLLKAGEKGTLLQALKEVNGKAEQPEPELLDEAAQMRKKAQEMLQQAGYDPRFFAALQEAASAAGFEFELRPKPKEEDIDELRTKACARLVEASKDGSFAKALEETGDESTTEDHGLQEGDEVVERSNLRRYTVRDRTKTEVLLQALGGIGPPEWKSVTAVDKVPKLNMARAIEIKQQEIYAPAAEARRGDEVRRVGNPRARGSILQRTTTDALLKMEDGTETWHGVEDLEQVLSSAANVEEGEEVITAQRGKRGRAKTRTTGEVLVLHDDGTEEWHEIAGLGCAKTRVAPGNRLATPDIRNSSASANLDLFNEVDGNHDGTISLTELQTAVESGTLSGWEEVEEAKENARDALMTALLGSSDDKELSLAKQNAQDALMAALLSGSDEDIELAKQCAREALTSALLSDKAPPATAEAPGTVPLTKPFSKYYRSYFALGASTGEQLARQLFGKLQEPRSEPPPESQKKVEVVVPPLLPFSGFYRNAFCAAETPGDLARRLFPGAAKEASPPAAASSSVNVTQIIGAPLPTSPALSAGGYAELEGKIRTRNERFKKENDALRRENTRLKALRQDKTQIRTTGPDAS